MYTLRPVIVKVSMPRLFFFTCNALGSQQGKDKAIVLLTSYEQHFLKLTQFTSVSMSKVGQQFFGNALTPPSLSPSVALTTNESHVTSALWFQLFTFTDRSLTMDDYCN